MARRKFEQTSAETDLPSNEFLTAADIETIQKAYDLVGLERICSLKKLKKAIAKSLLEHHPDRTANTPHAKKSADKTKQLTAALESVNSLLASKQKYDLYILFQNSSFALLSRHPQFSKEIFRYHTTFTYYQYGQEMKMKPTEEGLRNLGPLIQQNITVFINLLFPALQKINSEFIPTVLKEGHDDLTVITAENYTTSELLVLFNLVVSGEYTLPYPLRYKTDTKTVVDSDLRRHFDFCKVYPNQVAAWSERVLQQKTKESANQALHRLLTLAINLELANRDYYDYAIDEVSSVEYIRNVTEWLWIIASIVFMAGILAMWIATDIFAVTSSLFIVPILAATLLIPAILCLVAMTWGYFPVKNFNTFIANTSAMFSEYFFINCWKADIAFNNLAFLKALTLSEVALNTLSVENTSVKSLQTADFTLGEKTGNFASSLFGSSKRSNQYISLVEREKLQEIKVDDGAGSSVPTYGTSAYENVD